MIYNFKSEEFNFMNFQAFLKMNFPNCDTENSSVLSDFDKYKEQGKEFEILQKAIDLVKPFYKLIEADLIESGYIDKLRDNLSHNRFYHLPEGEFLCFALEVTNEDSFQRRVNAPDDWRSVVVKWKTNISAGKMF
jgi:hypothetical protein